MTNQRCCTVVAGLLATLVLTICFHSWSHPPPASDERRFTSFLVEAMSLPGAAAYFTVSVGLAFFFRRVRLVTLGMVLPWPLAFALELSADSSSHLFFPFEIAFFWLPALVIALLGAGVGKFLAGYYARRRNA